MLRFTFQDRPVTPGTATLFPAFQGSGMCSADALNSNLDLCFEKFRKGCPHAENKSLKQVPVDRCQQACLCISELHT